MQTLKEVSDARALMTEAMDWSVMRWLSEKKRVRAAADSCNATLDRVEHELQESWGEELKAAFARLNGGHPETKVAPEVERLAMEIKDIHDAALFARRIAEETFEKAEKRMSVSLAREGCQKAIAGWDLHETAIRKSEIAMARK